MPEINNPDPSARVTCDVPGCEAPITWVSRAVADHKTPSCTLHTAETQALRQAQFVQDELERTFDTPKDLAAVIQEAQELVQKLVVVAALREALTRDVAPAHAARAEVAEGAEGAPSATTETLM